MDMTIGQVARAAGCKVQTVRYYEQIGLLPEAPRSQGNQRLYDDEQVDRLRFIRHARELGFPLNAIRALLGLADNPDTPCDAANVIASTQLEAVRRRMSRLQALESELERMLAQCQGGKIADCRIIEVLRDHS